MTVQLSQVDIIQDSSPAPDLFVQVRVTTGETLEGKIWLYGRDGNTLEVRAYGEIDMATTPPDVTLTNVDGYDYYAFDISLAFPTTQALLDYLAEPIGVGPTEKVNSVVVTAATGDDYEDIVSALVFGDKNPSSVDGVPYTDGPLAGETIGSVTNPPADFVEGGDYYQDAGPGPFIIDEDGNVVSGPSDPNHPCFLAGTLIATETGEVPVETLAIGDLLRRADGGITRVKWIGRKEVLWAFHPADRLMPVRISAGALGDGLPHSDLTVTADHGMVVDGLLCNAGVLVNGGTIRRVGLSETGPRFTVYHIETENHDVILANGAPTETFVDYVGRQAFDNYHEYIALYGRETAIKELDLPRISSARLLPLALQERLKISENSEQDARFTGDLSDQKLTA